MTAIKHVTIYCDHPDCLAAEAERDTAAAVADRLLDGWQPIPTDATGRGFWIDPWDRDPQQMTDAEVAYIRHQREMRT